MSKRQRSASILPTTGNGNPKTPKRDNGDQPQNRHTAAEGRNIQTAIPIEDDEQPTPVVAFDGTVIKQEKAGHRAGSYIVAKHSRDAKGRHTIGKPYKTNDRREATIKQEEIEQAIKKEPATPVRPAPHPLAAWVEDEAELGPPMPRTLGDGARRVARANERAARMGLEYEEARHGLVDIEVPPVTAPAPSNHGEDCLNYVTLSFISEPPTDLIRRSHALRQNAVVNAELRNSTLEWIKGSRPMPTMQEICRKKGILHFGVIHASYDTRLALNPMNPNRYPPAGGQKVQLEVRKDANLRLGVVVLANKHRNEDHRRVLGWMDLDHRDNIFAFASILELRATGHSVFGYITMEMETTYRGGAGEGSALHRLHQNQADRLGLRLVPESITYKVHFDAQCPESLTLDDSN
ncbi:hypothetical protein BJ508DRAFT_327762 [Ascobolus immersus RN42]|uniref:Uncharacterized protein n=1 Tax=Ascobolus immersus RN42 TaxID=1160509 RepID=A0A3N4I3Q7_ASCIM|nr:hypothetical protein BJ508DRAFT_327762 [Ascobolus immersus RN42]